MDEESLAIDIVARVRFLEKSSRLWIWGDRKTVQLRQTCRQQKKAKGDTAKQNISYFAARQIDRRSDKGKHGKGKMGRFLRSNSLEYTLLFVLRV